MGAATELCLGEPNSLPKIPIPYHPVCRLGFASMDTQRYRSAKCHTIPAAEADDLFISVGVFIHWLAEDDKKIQDYNYQAVKESIKRAVNREPSAATVVAKKGSAAHPFQAK